METTADRIADAEELLAVYTADLARHESGKPGPRKTQWAAICREQIAFYERELAVLRAR